MKKKILKILKNSLYSLDFRLSSKDNPTGHSERKKKKRQTEEEVGRQYQSGHEWTLPAQLGQLNAGQGGKGLLRIYLWCPDDHPRLLDRIK